MRGRSADSGAANYAAATLDELDGYEETFTVEDETGRWIADQGPEWQQVFATLRESKGGRARRARPGEPRGRDRRSRRQVSGKPAA